MSVEKQEQQKTSFVWKSFSPLRPVHITGSAIRKQKTSSWSSRMLWGNWFSVRNFSQWLVTITACFSPCACSFLILFKWLST